MIVNQIKDFVSNMMRAASGICSGQLERLEASKKLARLTICKKCPDNRFDHHRYMCRECGCRGRFLELKASVNLWKCPLGHWEEIDSEEIESPFGYCEVCKAIIIQKDAEGGLTCLNKHYVKKEK